MTSEATWRGVPDRPFERRHADVEDPTARLGRGGAAAPSFRNRSPTRRRTMLWLILGIVLLVIAIAGGVIIHP